MVDAAEFELQREPEPNPPPSPRQPSFLPLMIGALMAVAAVAAYLYLRQPADDGNGVEGTEATESTVAPAAPLGVDVEPIDLPPLEQTDPLVRMLVSELSSHPRIAAWLTTDGLIRNFVVVTTNIAAGQSPARHLSVLKPAQPFASVEADGSPVVDVRSYERYDPIAAAAASVDTAGAARLYSTLKPRLDEAYAELGQQGTFDQVLERAIVRLLATPAVAGEVALVPHGGLLRYNDSRLEQLTAAQKHLLRMGPRNTRTVQAKLRDIALALGVPPERLTPR